MTEGHGLGASHPLTIFKSVYSTCLLIFSITLIMGLIFTEQTKIAVDVHPAFAFVIIWICIIWLTMIEGSQASIVGLEVVDREMYKETHPKAYLCSLVSHKGDNLKRFILGRQFMVVLVVFAINNAGHPLEGAELWGLPEMLQKIFLGSGLAMIFFTVMVGQLSSEVNASVCMLDYLNNYFAVLTLYVSLALEFSGILHSGYVIQMIVEKLSGSTPETNEPPRTFWQNVFFWLRCIMSLALLVFAFVVTLTALFQGKTTMWDGVPPYLSVIIFFALMSVVGLLEATQIAYFAVAKMKKADRGSNIWAKKSCEIIYKNEDTHGALNLASYMIGRQLCVVSCMFFVARVTSLNIKEGDPNLFGVSDWAQQIFNTGLLGAFITTIVGSIAWRLAGNAFPIFFLSTPPAYIFLRICMGLEGSGVCNGARVIAWFHKKIAGFQLDEVYIGTAEERHAAQARLENDMDAYKMEKGKKSELTAREVDESSN